MVAWQNQVVKLKNANRWSVLDSRLQLHVWYQAAG